MSLSKAGRSKSVTTPVTPSFTLTKPDDNVSENICQNTGCQSKDVRAAKVCHHSDCQEKNENHPLMLCTECDNKLHEESAVGHLRFDVGQVNTNSKVINRNKCATLFSPDNWEHHSDPEDKADKDNSTVSPVSNYVSASLPRANTKLRRKKVIKNRRYYTDDSMGLRSKSLGADDFQRVAMETADEVDGPSSYLFTGSRSPSHKTAGFFKKHSIGKECFTVRFYDCGEPSIEIVAALNGITLREALQPICEKRSIDVNAMNVFLDSSNTPLPLQFDTFRLGGVQLHIKAKEGEDPFVKMGNRRNNNKPTDRLKVDKKLSQGMRSARKNGITDENSAAVDSQSNSSPYNSLSRPRSYSKISSIFGTTFSKEKDKQDVLNEKLTNYSINGLPCMPQLLTIGQPQFPDSVFELETHWTAFVDNCDQLTKKQREQQEAIWELLNTEVEYIKSLKVISDLFSCCLINLQNEQLLNEIETEKLFSNISEIEVINNEFWSQCMLPVIVAARQNRLPLDPSIMKEGFKKFEETFHPYTKYCLEQKLCQEYYKSRYQDNDLFKAFVVWAEAQKQCKRLKLNDLLVKPMQRLTKYALLLRAIHKKTEDESTRDDLKEMMECVDTFVKEVDSALRRRHEQERLAAIITRIESYDAIEAPNEESFKILQEYSAFDLTRPMPHCLPRQRRNLLMEKPLRLKESTGKMDVTCFLFTDMFLVTKSNKRDEKVRIVKPPMRVDKIIAHELRDGGGFTLLYLNEFHTASAAYTFHGDNIRGWINKIKHAQEVYKKFRHEAISFHQQLTYLYDNDDDVYYPANMLGVPVGQISTSSSHENLRRQVSAESAEGQFLPNLNERRFRENQLQSAPTDYDDRRRSTSGLLKVDSDSSAVLHRGRSHSTGMLSPPSLSVTLEDNQSDVDLGYTPQFLITGNTPIPSPMGSPTSRHRTSLKHVKSAPVIDTLGTNRVDSFSSGDTDSPRVRLSPVEKHQFFIPDALTDDSKGKLNQRRTSRTEKRYHTADAIREMNVEKDNTIHKRLSWNFPTVDISIEERSSILKNKAFSSESLRSIRSSSGVSSNGSLHLSPESEITEESEYQENNNTGLLKHSESDSSDMKQRRSSCMKPEINQEEMNIKNTINNKSKSLSDLSLILSDLSRSEMQDGITSVDLPPMSPHRRKLSHAEILRMRKQLLLNSNVEASEV